MSNYNASVMISEKSKTLVVVNSFKFRYHKNLSEGILRWACSQKKNCKAYLKTQGEENGVPYIVDCSLQHNHEPESEKLNRQRISNSLKRKALEDICAKPAKLLHTVLETDHPDSLTTKDVLLIRNNIYNARQKVLPKLPTTVVEVHDILSRLDVLTNKGENFLCVNDTVFNIVMFSCRTNLRFLSTFDTVYVDGKSS